MTVLAKWNKETALAEQSHSLSLISRRHWDGEWSPKLKLRGPHLELLLCHISTCATLGSYVLLDAALLAPARH